MPPDAPAPAAAPPAAAPKSAAAPKPAAPATPPPAAAPPAAPPAEPLLKNWREHLDKEIATDGSLADFKSPSDIAKSYVNLRKLIGRDKVPIPADDAPQEQWDAFYERIGRPKDSKGYGLSKPEDLPDWFQYKEETETAFADLAHKEGLSAKQAKNLWGWLNGHAKESMSSVAAANNQRLESEWSELRGKWGKAYEANIKAAQQVALKVGGPEYLEWLKKTGISKEPMAVKFHASLAAQVLEGDLKDGKGEVVMAPSQAKMKISKIMEDPTHPYHQGKPTAIEEMAGLFKLAYPEEKG